MCGARRPRLFLELLACCLLLNQPPSTNLLNYDERAAPADHSPRGLFSQSAAYNHVTWLCQPMRAAWCAWIRHGEVRLSYQCNSSNQQGSHILHGKEKSARVDEGNLLNAPPPLLSRLSGIYFPCSCWDVFRHNIHRTFCVCSWAFKEFELRTGGLWRDK